MQYLQIPIDCDDSLDNNLHFDVEWVAILSKTHFKLLSSESKNLSDDLIDVPTVEVW